MPARPGDAVAQHTSMAGEEIQLVSHLQREHVTRVRNGDIFQNAGGLVPAPVQQMADRGNMPGFLRRHR